MNRLGIPLQHLQEVRRDLAALSSRGIHPAGIFSHLAMAEDPSAPLSVRQLRAFRALHAELRPIVPDSTDFHLGNSAALWRAADWGLGHLTTRARPGLSLYGIAPRELKERRHLRQGLRPVMELLAPVVAVQQLKSRDQVGYGGRFVAPRPMKIAILGMGYADGLPRLWGQKGSGAVARIGSRDCEWLGTVSMDLSAVRAPSGVRVGGQARILGEGIDAWKQADAAGTIPYELLTSLSARVQRIYG
jgi:alanine racemase